METSLSPTIAGTGMALDQLAGLLRDGGPILVVLVLVSLLAATLILLKLLQLARLRVGARDFVTESLRLWQARRPNEALAQLDATANPIAPVLATAMRGLGHPGADAIEQVRDEVLREAAARRATPKKRTSRCSLPAHDLSFLPCADRIRTYFCTCTESKKWKA